MWFRFEFVKTWFGATFPVLLIMGQPLHTGPLSLLPELPSLQNLCSSGSVGTGPVLQVLQPQLKGFSASLRVGPSAVSLYCAFKNKSDYFYVKEPKSASWDWPLSCWSLPSPILGIEPGLALARKAHTHLSLITSSFAFLSLFWDKVSCFCRSWPGTLSSYLYLLSG
jgi:hypothetical protein